MVMMIMIVVVMAINHRYKIFSQIIGYNVAVAPIKDG